MMKAYLKLCLLFTLCGSVAAACSANEGVVGQNTGTGAAVGMDSGTGGAPIVDGSPCVGCTPCSAQGTMCVGNEVHSCKNGEPGALLETCNAGIGLVCDRGFCVSGCEKAESDPSNIGCEFWAVDLDQADLITNPAAYDWGLAIANAGGTPAVVTIEQNDALPGQPLQTKQVWQETINPDDLARVTMPTREIDCGAFPNDHDAPGTCLTSRAFRVSSTQPIVVYQFNNLVHGYSTDASLLIPTPSLGTKYRVLGWSAAHSYPAPGAFIERAYITILGTQEKTKVTVYPHWRVRGNPPIAATKPGGLIHVELGPFDVLNLETDDATFAECLNDQDAPYCSDFTGSVVDSDKPVAVFSGTESSGVGVPFDAPKFPGWDEKNGGGCCLQHLEEQLFPLEAIGKKFIITRSPVRSTLSYEEPDVLRFMGGAETANVTTTLPPPYDKFTVEPGEVKETWTQKDIIVTSDKPVLVGQYLVSQGYIQGVPKGDPSFTIFPPVEQAQKNYVFLSPAGWKENWVVIAAETGSSITVDGATPTGCKVTSVGELDGKSYESRRCKISAGVHRLAGDTPFSIMAYGYANADAYSFAGGAAVKKIYEPPVVR